MKRPIFIAALFLGAAQFCFSQVTKQSAPQPNLQMGFEENKGQLAAKNGNLLPDVLFKSRGTGPGIYITTSGLTYVFAKQNEVAKNDDAAATVVNWAKVEMNIEGANIQKDNIVCENELPGYSNFYYAHCPQGILNVKSWQHITIKNIYPGIDWVFNADNKSGLSHDFIVHPGADANLILINYKGTNEAVTLDQSGRLKISCVYGVMYEGGLNVYEQQSGNKIAAEFSVHKNQLSFSLGKYNTNDLLVIDPPLQWSMPQTSTGADYGYAVAAARDGSFDVLVAGATDGTDFPVLNAYQGTSAGLEDMVMERLTTLGARVWSTYYGGSDYDQAKSIASDANGNCYVAGNTGSNDFPVLNALQANYGNGVYDAAIVKLNASGVRQFATWYGSTGNDYGTAITADAAGNIYVTGYTSSANFVTLNPVQATKNIGYDAFIMKLNASCALQWATFYGGDDDDKARAITMDATGANIYITGTTLSGGFPATPGVFQNSSASAYNAEDAFVLKMSAAQVIGFASYCGGSDADFGQGIAVDNSGAIYITGYTLSSNFPVVNPGNGAYFDNTIGSIGTHDAFVVKCNANGSARLWSTYFGGTSPDLAFGIAYDPAAGIYISGHTSSTDFPLHIPFDLNYYQSTHGDAGSYNDMFFAWFGATDSLRWSTYYGDASSNECYGICTDANSNIYAVGVSNNDIDVLKFGPGAITGIHSSPAYASSLVIYPNPAHDVVNVNFDAAETGIFEIGLLNAQGKLISKTAFENTFHQRYQSGIDMKNFAAGFYFIRVSYPSGRSEVVKFVRE